MNSTNVVAWRDAIERLYLKKQANKLAFWMVASIPKQGIYFIGYDITNDCSIHTRIAEYDQHTRIGTTFDNKYELYGNSSVYSEALYNFTQWCILTGIQSFRDISHEYEETLQK